METIEQLIARLTRERDQANAHVTELQTKCTAQELELRRVAHRRLASPPTWCSRLVRQFFVMAEQPQPKSPCVPDVPTVRLRVELIVEEFRELLESVFGAKDSPSYRRQDNWGKMAHLAQVAGVPIEQHVDLPAFVDAAVDLLYVIHGALIAFGVDVAPVFAEVHLSNMAKRGGPRREDGKLLKDPSSWVPPDIAGELRKQGWQG